MPSSFQETITIGNGKLALVLGGGGMFGAYEAGVWLALQNRFDFDLVAGASIGALNGWFAASGCPAQEWVETWLDLAPAAMPRFRFPRRPLGGVVQSEVFEEFVQGLHSRFPPRVPFTVALTDLLRLEPYAVSTPRVEWIHLAASCAVFGIFPQYRIDGHLTTDGGLLGSVPLWAAERAGATHMVAVNILPRGGPPWLRVARSALLSAARNVPAPPRDARVLTIEHPSALGAPREMIFWSRESASRFVELGRRDAEAALPGIDRMLETF